MAVDFAKPRRIRALMRQDPDFGWGLGGQFAGFPDLVRLAAATRSETDPKNATALKRALGHLRPLNDDVMTLFSVLLRAEIDFRRRLEGALPEGLWFQFSRQDVEFFMLVLRSAFDHAAGFVVCAAPTTEWVAQSSFESLRSKCADPRGPEKLGAEWTALIRASGWFEELRDWRVALAHHGGVTLTFFDAEAIPFQIHVGPDHKIAVPEIMFNEYVGDFTKFAALYLCYFLCFLEDATLISKRYLDLHQAPLPATIHSGGGVDVLRRWTDRLLASAPAPSSPQATP